MHVQSRKNYAGKAHIAILPSFCWQRMLGCVSTEAFPRGIRRGRPARTTTGRYSVQCKICGGIITLYKQSKPCEIIQRQD